VVRAAGRQLALDGADVSGLFAFRPGRSHERHALIFGEAFKTVGLYILEMCEQIATACIRGNKAEALGIVKPFYGAGLGSHLIFPFALN
jgi:hypothetical protein